MIKRILAAWFIANFAVIGLVSWLRGGWYAGWLQNTVYGIVAQLSLVMLPNLLLPLLILRFGWINPVSSLRAALGWRWNGWRSLIAGVVSFILAGSLTILISRLVGPGIPYSVPGVAPLEAHTVLGVLGLLFLLLLFVGLTVAAEETMFRGLIQTQIEAHYGSLVAILATTLLFGLRHLPDDIFYAGLWHATPLMWLSRQLQLYALALFLSLARVFGRSTFSSAIVHALTFVMIFTGV